MYMYKYYIYYVRFDKRRRRSLSCDIVRIISILFARGLRENRHQTNEIGWKSLSCPFPPSSITYIHLYIYTHTWIIYIHYMHLYISFIHVNFNTASLYIMFRYTRLGLCIVFWIYSQYITRVYVYICVYHVYVYS